MKRYRVRLRPDLVAFIRHLHPEIRSRLRNALEAIEMDPFLGKPLKDPLEGLYSFRVSDYRIVYEIRRQEILIEVIDIARRRIVYQRVAELLKRLH